MDDCPWHEKFLIGNIPAICQDIRFYYLRLNTKIVLTSTASNLLPKTI